ncbi:hypothetical protein GCM10009721_28360 [Terrabacter tumescens]|uniref:Uncharacterized protein n=1 Tax=Terrabacter tumescens TaxID=60443 RepID=A0ABQ2I3R9_9MICO|nr:DUF6338 family protein [Terrabacter tumescens]GGM99654.1 hypothetical protein GCM10009721_28360 [Terrabacter tumescens]
MVPETLGAILVFLAFIAPGLAFELLRERRRPFIEETAFREASRIALTSMLFSLGGLSVLAVAQALGATWVVDSSRWLTDGQAYVSAHLGQVTASVLVFVGVSLGLSLLADWLLRRSAPGRIVPGSVWFALFRQHRPDGATPWVHLRLKDGTELWGFVGDYTPDQKLENRELVLEQPRLQYRRPGQDQNVMLPTWSFVSVRGEDIAWMKVQYIEDGPRGGVVPARYKAPPATAFDEKPRPVDRPSGTDLTA